MIDLNSRLDAIFARRDRDDMQPTIDAFEEVLREHPDEPRVVYEVGGAYDTAGQEERAVGYYERALELGLDGELRRRCLLQYGSTLRNIGRLDDSLAVLDGAIFDYPSSVSLPVFKALTLHAAGRPNAALAELLVAIADHVHSAEITRYEAALRGNASYLRGLGD
jgi:tetratricopeptide (TPR) repeat protein